jgi:hypothetical protein
VTDGRGQDRTDRETIRAPKAYEMPTSLTHLLKIPHMPFNNKCLYMKKLMSS